ncbi:hypothetical protein KKG66_03825 [bacterium]|nr:hypothetical protein [bacterium]
MKKLLCLLCFGLFALSGNTFAQLEDIEIEGSNSLRWENGDEVDERRANNEYPNNTIARRFVENQLRLDLYANNLRFGGRLLYFRPSDYDKYQYGIADTTHFDKLYIEAKIAQLSLRAGDFSELWGYGLALSLFENRDLYFDSELEGIRAKLEVGPLRLTGLSGTTPNGFLVKRTDVTAGRAEVGGSEGALGFSYVRNDSGIYRESNVAAVDWKFTRGVATVYGEQAWKDTYIGKHPDGSDRILFGRASFWGINLNKWNWSLLLEYNNYNYKDITPIQNPPAVYREVGPRLLQGREPHYLNIGDEVGYQLELSGSVTEEIYSTFHYNLSSHHPENQGGFPRPTLQQEDSPFWEMFGNAEWYLPGGRTTFLELGANEEASVVWQDRLWAHAKYTTPFKDNQELEFEVEQLLITEHIGDDDHDYHDQLFSVGWIPSGGFSIYALYQMSDDENLKKKEGDNWLSVESSVSFGGGKHRLILFYGRERGGLKCSNGVCRQVQAFEGFRLSLETSL